MNSINASLGFLQKSPDDISIKKQRAKNLNTHLVLIPGGTAS